jgi:hypothetical protein
MKTSTLAILSIICAVLLNFVVFAGLPDGILTNDTLSLVDTSGKADLEDLKKQCDLMKQAVAASEETIQSWTMYAKALCATSLILNIALLSSISRRHQKIKS